MLARLRAGDRRDLVDRLRAFSEAATARVTALREQLAVAEGFAGDLADRLAATP
ncbi:hypothetical protein [Geodermatophilus sp. CPCC 206100]|uniref:hypothetical protein n=1 Tax=Geodermatophilus sp. CPCC 206100 TaxID=3020054 RepID=UPI003AFFAFA2